MQQTKHYQMNTLKNCLGSKMHSTLNSEDKPHSHIMWYSLWSQYIKAFSHREKQLL